MTALDKPGIGDAMSRHCAFADCQQRARLPAASTSAGREYGPFFCTVKHAALWAMVSVSSVWHWCEEGHHYVFWALGAARPCEHSRQQTPLESGQ